MAHAPALSKRERQVIEALYRLGEATVAEVQEALGEGTNYNAVRGMLRILTEKGRVDYRQEGARYVFRPAEPKEQAAANALTGLVRTFFDGSVEQTVATLLSSDERNLTDEELDRLGGLIERAKKERK